MTKDEFGKLLERRSKRLKGIIRKLERQQHAMRRYLEKYNLVIERLREKEQQLNDPTGAPGIWKGEVGYELFLHVEAMRERTGCTTKAALTALRKIQWPLHEQLSVLAKYSVTELQI